jgi:hypothetical protein
LRGLVGPIGEAFLQIRGNGQIEHFGGMADLLCRAPARHLLLTL